uniref:Uncharacterized protein n=1 Tax=Ananas comosus var. bracteatus TaxID=296719 RepID=A0A6V7PER3_ANACO|nr:unnamed protein product [Ananas comosus var. bracteatus]
MWESLTVALTLISHSADPNCDPRFLAFAASPTRIGASISASAFSPPSPLRRYHRPSKRVKRPRERVEKEKRKKREARGRSWKRRGEGARFNEYCDSPILLQTLSLEKMMLIKPTWGNIRIGISFMAALKRYKIVISMPSYTSVGRKVVIRAYGTNLVLNDPPKGWAEP